MPTAFIFLPCERPLVDAFTDELSIVGILDSIQPPLLPTSDDRPPRFKDAIYFLPPFFIVTSWMKMEDDDDEWEQLVTLTAPDEQETEISPPTRLRFEMMGERIFHRTKTLTGRLYGISTLSLKLRKLGNEEWQTVLTYPLFIEEFSDEPDEDEPRDDTPEA